jgi:double-stranded uracil-DNA glycosylase
MTRSRPSKAQLQAARGATLPDLIGPGLRVLFCGINPSLYSAVVGHHFARPGNRFWPTLHASGFTPRLLRPSEEPELLASGSGITNVVERATATAAELSAEELIGGGERLRARVMHHAPRVLAVLGITAYRESFHRPGAAYGLQPETIGATRLWVLPNPSGLNAHFQLPELARVFAELRHFVEQQDACADRPTRR